MDPKLVVLDISSDEESCGGGGDGDYDWISEFLDDDDDAVLVGEFMANPKQRLKSSVKDLDDDSAILDGDPDKPVAIENDKAGESDDLLIVGEKG